MPQKPWLLLLILGSSAFACRGTLPERPMTDICMVSYPAPTPEEPVPFQGCICSRADGSEVYHLPWEQCDTFVAMSPAAFHALGNYVLAVEEIAYRKCRANGSAATETLNDLTLRYTSLLPEAPEP